MGKAPGVVCLVLLNLAGCAGRQVAQSPVSPGKRLELACEQKALIAQEQFIARIKAPDDSRSYSSAWAGSARSDNGMRVFRAALAECLQHAHHAANRQP